MKKVYSFVIFLLIFYYSNASHIKGGQISHEKITSTHYKITFTGYRDGAAGVELGNGIVDFGDGSAFGGNSGEVIPWIQPEDVGNGIEKWSFSLIHTYNGAREYIVSYSEENRSGDIMNISGSLNQVFYIESSLVIDPLLQNSCSKNTLDPLFLVPSGHKFEVNLNFIDPDNDSLSYQMIVPQTGVNSNVSGYLFPSDPSFSKSNQQTDFGIHPISGNLFWDSPSLTGKYSVAIKIKEWRKLNGQYLTIGYTVLDFVLEVVDFKEAPRITTPQTICHSSDEQYSNKVTIENTNNYDLNIHFETELTDLLVDGLPASDWNNLFSETTFSENLIELVLEIPMEKMKDLSGFNRTLISVSAELEFSDINSQTLANINFTPAFLIATDCDEELLIPLAVGEYEEFKLTYTNNSISINSSEQRSHTIQIFDLAGNELMSEEIGKGIFTVSYPFQANTVYLIFVENSNGHFTQKVIFH